MPLPLKLAFRRVARNPGFCAISVLLLALGVAVSSLTFGIANSRLLRPLPFPEPDRLVRVFRTSSRDAFQSLAPGTAIEIREQLEIADFALFVTQSFNVSAPGETPVEKPGLSVMANFLDVLGVKPALGRGFLPNEDELGQANVTLITDSFWREHFGGDRGVLGKQLRIETQTYTVIGVLPPSFEEALLWRKLAFVHASSAWRGWRNNHGSQWINLVGRLAPGVTLSQADARLQAFAAQLRREYPAETGSNGLRFAPFGTSEVRGRSVLWLIVGLAVLVLVIACANLGALQLARTLSRQGELAIRSALGAKRTELMAAIGLESVLIAIAGSGVGVLVTIWARAFMVRWLPLPPIYLDFRVIGFDVLLTSVAILFFGVMPAWLGSDANVSEALKTSAASIGGGRQHRRVKTVLIVAQIGMAVVLVSTAFSFVLGVRTFIARDRGWQPSGLVSGLIHLPWGRVEQERNNPTVARLLRTKLAAIPGVETVSVVSNGPIYGAMDGGKVFVEGAAPVVPGREPRAFVSGVDASFFRLMRIRVREGSLLPETYRMTDPRTAVVSRTFARRGWPDGSAIGKRVKFDDEPTWREVVGVVDDISLAVGYSYATPGEQAYIPTEERAVNWFNFILRSPLPAAALERSIRRAVAEIDPDIMVTQLGDVPAILEEEGSNRVLTLLLSTFSTAGLVIALLGLYGMMTQLVNERRREIGIRIAVGADHARIISMIMRSGARILIAGIIFGLGLAWFSVQLLLRDLPELPIPGISADLFLSLALMAVGALACLLPAVRASRLNPIDVLRTD